MYFEDKTRQYRNCSNCDLIFVEQKFWLSKEGEKKEYDLHQNSPNDLGYRKFLSRLYSPLKSRLNSGAIGLDFGCGPGPTLSIMFEETGFDVSLYDKFYNQNLEVFNKSYDFITATEVLEHLQNPHLEIKRLTSCLKPDGHLGVMTKLSKGLEAFEKWHYKNDQTHICFYSKKSFDWISNEWNLKIDYIKDDVILLKS